MSQASTLVAGRYRLGHTLGRGGMADVHAGHDLRLGREVAVKVLRADLARDPLFRLRFEREAQNVAGLNHPGIVAVYDTGEVPTPDGLHTGSGPAGPAGGLPFIVMEYVSGSTLRDLLRTHGRMDPARACAVMADTCGALGFSHAHGVVHRDVKPANIMITPGEVVKVMDFGIARATAETGPGLTGADVVIGTAQYLAPEQGLGQEVDARADVYAAGCVLFELITGEPPFTGDSPVAIVYQHVREDPPLPSALAAGVSSDVDAVVLRAMAKNPENRYRTAAEMRADLERVLAGERPEAPAVLGHGAERNRTLGTDPTGPQDLDLDGGPATGPSTGPFDTGETPLTHGVGRGPRTGAHAAVPTGRRRASRRVLVAGALVLVALLGAGAWALSGSDAGQVPRLVGLSQDDAVRAVTDAGLAPIVVPTASPPDQTDRVVAASPDVGARVDADTPVTLRVGRGPGLIQVPLLVGRSPEAARVAAEQAGLVLTPVPQLRETDDATEVGAVVGQNPVPGSLLPAGAPVELVVGERRATLQVPDVTGRDRATAVATLEGVGLEVTVREVDGTPGSVAGAVVALRPGAGSTVDRGSTVTLDVARATVTSSSAAAPSPSTGTGAGGGATSGDGAGGGAGGGGAATRTDQDDDTGTDDGGGLFGVFGR